MVTIVIPFFTVLDALTLYFALSCSCHVQYIFMMMRKIEKSIVVPIVFAIRWLTVIPGSDINLGETIPTRLQSINQLVFETRKFTSSVTELGSGFCTQSSLQQTIFNQLIVDL